jgi:hypothetical protein
MDGAPFLLGGAFFGVGVTAGFWHGGSGHCAATLLASLRNEGFISEKTKAAISPIVAVRTLEESVFVFTIHPYVMPSH